MTVDVEVKGGVATLPTLSGSAFVLPLALEWWKPEADFHALLEYEATSFDGEGGPEFDYEAVVPALEAEVDRARPHHERLEDLKLVREGLPLGRLASEIAIEPEPEHAYLVPGLLRVQGVTLVTGREKRSGKSTLLAYLVGALERGEATIFGEAYPEPVRTVWITEEPTYSLREKIEMFGLSTTYMVTLSEWENDSEFDLATFAGRVKAMEGLALAYDAQHVVIDPLSRIANIKDEAGAGELNEACNAVSVLAQKAGVAVTLIHHDNKADGRAVEDKARGTTATSAAMDQILHIERRWPVKDPDARELVAWGRVKASDWNKVVRFDKATNTYEVVTETPDDADAAASLRADAELLESLGSATRASWVEATGGDPEDSSDLKAAGRRLKALVKAELAAWTKEGRETVYRPDVDMDSI